MTLVCIYVSNIKYNKLCCHVSNVQKINIRRKSVWYLIKVILECEMSIKRNYPRNASINGSSDNYSVRLRYDKKKDRSYAPPPHHPLILNRNRQFVKSRLRCQSKRLILTGGKNPKNLELWRSASSQLKIWMTKFSTSCQCVRGSLN